MTAIYVPWGPASLMCTLSTAVCPSLNMTDANRYVANVFQVPKAGTIDRVWVRASTVTGNPPAHNVGIVTVTAATGFPTTTAYGGSALESYDVTDTNGAWVTLTTPVTAVAGEIAAVSIASGATPPDGSNYLTLAGGLFVGPGMALPHYATYDSGGNLGSGIYTLGARYADPDNAFVLPSLIAPNSGTFKSDSDPDEIGCLFQVPMDCTCVGAVVIWGYPGVGTADFTIKLYNAANGLLGSSAVDISQYGQTGANAYQHHSYWAAVNLTKDTDYRLTYLPGTTNTSQLAIATVNEAASRAWWPDGSRWQRTHRTDAGAWTEVTTQLPMMALLLSDVTFGAAAVTRGSVFAG